MATKKVHVRSGAGDGSAAAAPANDTSSICSMESHQSRETFPFRVLRSISDCLKTGRQVCTQWNNGLYEIDSGLQIQILTKTAKFIKLITKKRAQLVRCKTVTILYRIDPLDPRITLFLKTCGNEIKELKFDYGIKLSSSSFLSVRQSCQNLTEVDLTAEQVATIELPTDHKSSCPTPLPQLTTLIIRGVERMKPENPDATEATSDFIIMLLRRAVNLRNLTLNSWDFSDWTKLANNSKVTPELQRLDFIHLEFYDLEVDLLQTLWNPQLNLRILEITLLNKELVAEQFSRLVEHISGTLEELAVCSQYRDARRSETETYFYLTFPCKMPQLKTLKLRTGFSTRIICSAPDILHNQNGNVVTLFPKLKTFQQTFKIHLIPHKYILQCPVFWENLFPVKPSTGKQPIEFIHENLTDINFDYKVDSYNIVNNIARSFPKLTKCSFKATKDQFQEILSLLKDHRIQKLSLTYIQRAGEGISDFTSSITGISLEECTNAEVDPTGENPIELLKIRPSLSDWKYLSDLTIWIHCELKEGNELALNNLCVQQGFVQMKQLKSLSLKRFQIESRHIFQILENVALEVFDLSICSIDSTLTDGWVTRYDAVESAAAAIRKKFPRVQLIERSNDSYEELMKDKTKWYKSRPSL